MAKKIGILTAGSDSPGLNAAIRAIGKTAIGVYGMELVGFLDGFHGLIHNHNMPIKASTLSGILTIGGTILGTSRDIPQDRIYEDNQTDLVDRSIQTYQELGLDALICIGGIETQEAGYRLTQHGLNVITIPKSIDNDVPMTDMTIGFSTAFEIAAQSIDRLHSTAHSHHRILVVEMMGRNAGWLTLAAGVTGGADVIVIPEIPYDPQKIALAIQKRKEAGKQFSIVAVAERIISQEQVEFIQYLKDINEMKHSGEEQEQVAERLERLEMRFTDSTLLLANRLEKYTGLETRITILGYLLRGGAPSAGDRMLATEFGTACVSLVNSNCFGIMIAKHGSKVEPVDLEQVVGKEKPVPLDHSWILSARAVGTQFGD